MEIINLFYKKHFVTVALKKKAWTNRSSRDRQTSPQNFNPLTTKLVIWPIVLVNHDKKHPVAIT